LARKSAEMTYPNAYENRKIIGKIKNQKVVVRSSGTGKIYGARAIAQQTVEGTLLRGAIDILAEALYPRPNIRITRLDEATLEHPDRYENDYADPHGGIVTPEKLIHHATDALKRVKEDLASTLDHLHQFSMSEDDDVSTHEMKILSLENTMDLLDSALEFLHSARQLMTKNDLPNSGS